MSGANTYTGNTTILAGVIADGIANALPTGSASTDSATLDLAGFNQQVVSVTGSGIVTDSGAAAVFTVNNAAADAFAGTLTGANLALTMSGTSTLTLTSANTYGGATTVSSGTLVDGIANALPAGTALSATGTFDLAGFAQQVGSVTAAGTVTDSGAAAVFTVDNAADDTFAGTLTGANLALTKVGAGTLILTSNSGFTGPTAVQGGALEIDGSNSGSPVALSAGTLQGAGTVRSINATGGIVSPGAGGVGTIGTLTTAAGAFATTLNGATFQVNVNTPAVSDMLVVGNGATLNLTGGNLSVNVLGSAASNVYTIISSASGGISGKFNSLINGAIIPAGGRMFRIDYSLNQVTLTDVQAPVITSTKWFCWPLRLTMTRYGPARVGPVGVSDITRRRLSNQGRRCCCALSLSIVGTNAS